ncbi:hypothetical protein [Delftia lacustris]|uniref:Uncharacterized protein n=1 Tax=Delftia lacustris TaxID=558537 RepID=A0A1H3QSP0_9BURK|nr:hypothetical protein [Delftia lacustris]SDZ16534.1 hypothetical protein SAMN05421547_113127 [Delftia lacustris]
MTKKPMFKLHPDGEQYILNLAGVVLICGNTIFGDPTETTPQGRTNAMRLVERFLQEAEKRGFKHTSTVWALMRRNTPNPRLANLVQEAMGLLPNDVQVQIIASTKATASTPAPAIQLVTATRHPGQHEPETNPHLLRPGPDGIDPRFWAAGNELKRIAEEEGEDAIHKPEHAHLYAKMLRYAPKDLRAEMEAKANELGIIPKATHVKADGSPVYSKEQLAAAHGVSIEEVDRFLAQTQIDPDDLYDGPVFPVQ